MAAPPSDSAADPLLVQLARLAARSSGFERGRVVVRPPATDGISPEHDSPEHDSPEHGSPKNDWAGLDAEVIRSGEVVCRESPAEPGPAGPGAGTYLGVPIRSGAEVTAVLRVTDPGRRPTTERQVALLGEFARLAELHLRPGRTDAELDDDRLAADLRRALRAGEIVPWYQPVVAFGTGRVIGVEALARWFRSDGTMEPPAHFIPVAERSDLVTELDLVIARQAFADLAAWQRTAPDFRLSVNLSGRHLDHAGWPETLSGYADAAGVAGSSVDLELTETARPRDIDLGARLLAEVRARGFSVWLDDFGAGFYDLRDLLRLTVDGIKIDRSFAAQLESPINHAVVGALTAGAKRVGIQVTLEGVETAGQAAVGRSLGCDFGQGFWWSRPVPAAQVAAWAAGTALPVCPG